MTLRFYILKKIHTLAPEKLGSYHNFLIKSMFWDLPISLSQKLQTQALLPKLV